MIAYKITKFQEFIELNKLKDLFKIIKKFIKVYFFWCQYYLNIFNFAKLFTVPFSYKLKILTTQH